MHILRTIQTLEHERTCWHGRIGFVPTMGYLHEGHRSLIRTARRESDTLVASIFVNPTQFGPHEDLARYPRALERDLTMLEALGVDAVFVPTTDEIYPPGFASYVEITGPLSTEGEGVARPTHFRGVATIVLKLFQLVRPHQAYFGQKDAQQVAVITRMVNDFHLPVTLRTLPTVREHNGLALSSRNSYLNERERSAATILYHALQAGRATFDAHPPDGPQAVIQAMRTVISREPLAQLEYAEVRHATTFLPLEELQAPALLLIAAKIGPARLIDNFALHPDGHWDTGTLTPEVKLS